MVDQIQRAGRTFKSKSGEKAGLLCDRPVSIGISPGGVFTRVRTDQPDFLMLSLSAVPGSAGLKTLQFLPTQVAGFLFGDQATLAREKALTAIDLTAMATAAFLAAVNGA